MSVRLLSGVFGKRSFAWAAVGGALLLPLSASGAIVSATFQNQLANPIGSGTYTGVATTFIAGNSTDNSHLNFGSAYDTKTMAAYQIYALLRFDLSQMQGQYGSITSAKLTLIGDYANTTQSTFGLHAISPANANWVQGTGGDSGVTETGGAATWAEKADFGGTGDVDWAGGAGLGIGTATPGYDPTAAASGTWDTVGNDNAPITIGLPVSLVESWITSPGDNGGVILMDDSNSGNFLIFKGSTTATQSPMLVITYDNAVPEPMSLGVLSLGGLILLRRRNARAK